jgi:hypothetical protein
LLYRCKTVSISDKTVMTAHTKCITSFTAK